MLNHERRNFDVAVIGAGPGGYVCAIRAAQLGLKVCCIDNWVKDGQAAPGGCCTNVGCIPTKALLSSTSLYDSLIRQGAENGITVGELEMDVPKMIERKDDIIRATNRGINYLFKKNNIEFINGTASFVMHSTDGTVLSIDEDEQITATHVVVATGSVPRSFPGIDFDEDRILSNEGALSLNHVPRTLAIIGAGVIGLEIGTIWARLGSEVRILEAQKTLLPFTDSSVAREASQGLSKQGLSMEFGVRIDSITNDGERVAISYANSEGEREELWAERLLISIGRVPNTMLLNCANVGLKLDDRGFIEVDDECRTNLPNVWAIGDVVRGPMLAHKAEEEGTAVAERIKGMKCPVDLRLVPSVIYTEPEIAWVGQTEEQLREAGREIKVGSFPFKANGRARALGHTEGFVKVIADAKTDEILGVHIFGHDAAELIGQAVQAMNFLASAEDLGMLCIAHPTLSEALKEAALATDKRAINF